MKHLRIPGRPGYVTATSVTTLIVMPAPSVDVPTDDMLPVEDGMAAADIVLHARHGDPDTSHEALAGYSREKMAAAADIAIRLYKQHGPMADFEYRAHFDRVWTDTHDDSLHRQARRQARDRGRIKDSAVRKVNPGTNRRQVVWEFVDGVPPEIRTCPTCGHILRKTDRLAGGSDTNGDLREARDE